MDPFTLMIAGLGAQAVGGVAGNLLSSGDRQKALQANQAAVQQWLDLHVPDVASQKVMLQQYVQNGKLDPKMEAQIKSGPTNLEKIQTGGPGKDAQLKALSQLEQLGTNGGLGLQDQATLQDAINNTNTQAKGTRDAVTDSFARRGLGGSGVELAAQLQGAQGATNQTGNAQLQAAASARQRALDAITGAGNLGGTLYNENYQQQSDLAKARDAIQNFNTQNLQGVTERNTNRSNDAQAYNVKTAQDIANMNTGVNNQQEVYNKGLIQQNYDNLVKQTAGASGQEGELAGAYNTQGNRTAGVAAGIGSAAGSTANAYAKYQNDAANRNANKPKVPDPTDPYADLGMYQVPEDDEFGTYV